MSSKFYFQNKQIYLFE